MANPEVLLIGLTPPVEGGSQRHIYEISSRLPSQVLTQRGTICKNKISLPIISKNNFLTNITFFLSYLIYSIKLLLIKKHKIIHIHENLLYLLAPILRLRYKVIITVHGISGFKFYDNKFLWFFFKLGLQTANKIISVDITNKEILEKSGFKKIIYIPNGVNLEEYKAIKPKPEKKITFMSRIHEQKGLIYLLEAFNKIKPLIPDYKLEIIAKENDYSAKLKKQFPDKRIIWKGFILDRKVLFSELASSYLLVFPSLWEALPWPALLEGLASSRPVIASSLPGMNKVFNSKQIILVKPKSSKEIAEKILFLIKNKKQADLIGKSGRKLSQDYSWDKIAKQVGEVYEKLK